MSAYIVGQVAVHDLVEYNKYLAGFPEAFAPFEGRVLVASDQVEIIEGVWAQGPDGCVRVSVNRPREALVQLTAYLAIAQYRFKAATSNLILTEGWKG